MAGGFGNLGKQSWPGLAKFPDYSRAQPAEDVMLTGEPIQITLVRSKITQCSLFVDSNLNTYSLGELVFWARRRTPFVIVEESTGEDITRVILRGASSDER
jgi:hypothetical protein